MRYLLHQSDSFAVRVGYDENLDAFRCQVTGMDGVLHDGQYSRAIDAFDAAQNYAGERLSTVWLWRMINDRDNQYRPKRVTTRAHNLEPGGRYAA